MTTHVYQFWGLGHMSDLDDPQSCCRLPEAHPIHQPMTADLLDDDATVSCPECSRDLPASALCGCEGDTGPLCPICCRGWHLTDRFDFGGSAA